MDNGTSPKVIDFFNKAASLPDKWDHNRQYQKYMLKHIKGSHGRFLDMAVVQVSSAKFLLRCVAK